MTPEALARAIMDCDLMAEQKPYRVQATFRDGAIGGIGTPLGGTESFGLLKLRCRGSNGLHYISFLAAEDIVCLDFFKD